MLSLRNFNLSCGGEELLTNVDADFEPGKIYALLGTNGIGKTCLLQALTGSATRQHESVVADGVSAMECVTYRKLVAATFETDGFVSGRFSGRELLPMIAALWKTDDASESLVSSLDMSAFVDKRIGSYSLGMRQLLRIAFTVQTGARYLLVDEPFNGLDPIKAELLGELLLRLKEAERCVIMPTHDLAHADAFCDEGVAISNETLAFGGGEFKPSELFAHCYQN